MECLLDRLIICLTFCLMLNKTNAVVCDMHLQLLGHIRVSVLFDCTFTTLLIGDFTSISGLFPHLGNHPSNYSQ